jgi:hypothetical protein
MRFNGNNRKEVFTFHSSDAIVFSSEEIPSSTRNPNRIMKLSELKIGMVCILDGETVEVVEFEAGGVVVEGQQNGQEFVKASQLTR